jgi:hypothetical protein
VAPTKKNEKPAAPALPAGVLQPGTIKATEDEEPPWWRAPAVFAGVLVVSFAALGVVTVVGKGTPPKAPLTHAAPEVLPAMDLDGVAGDALAKPVKIPGAGVIGQPAGQKVVSRAVARGRRFGAPAVEGPAAAADAPKPKARTDISYQPHGPSF